MWSSIFRIIIFSFRIFIDEQNRSKLVRDTSLSSSQVRNVQQQLLQETLVTDAEAAHTHGVHVSASDRLQRHYSLGPRPFQG